MGGDKPRTLQKTGGDKPRTLQYRTPTEKVAETMIKAHNTLILILLYLILDVK